MKCAGFLVAATVALALPTTANALLINTADGTVSFGAADVNQSFALDYFLGAGQSDNDGGAIPTYDLSALFTYTITSFSSGGIGLKIEITNTTIDPGGSTNADIVSFGFGVDPDATATFMTGGEGDVFVGIGSGNGGQQTYPGGYKGIDVCVFSAGCAGGSVTDALDFGESDTVKILLTGPFVDSVTLAMFPVKFQTDMGSFEFSGRPRIPVSEPATIALMAFGLMGLGALCRRKCRV